MRALSLLFFCVALSASPLRAAALDDYLSCAAELLPQSRGALKASGRVNGWFTAASHTELFVYAAEAGGTRILTYTYPEKSVLADNGDRAFFLRIPAREPARPLLLSVLQTEGGDWLDENLLPTADDERKYTQPVALNDNSKAFDLLRNDVFARLNDLPRWRADFQRRFPNRPRALRLQRCSAAQDPELQRAVMAARQTLGDDDRALGSVKR